MMMSTHAHVVAFKNYFIVCLQSHVPERVSGSSELALACSVPGGLGTAWELFLETCFGQFEKKSNKKKVTNKPKRFAPFTPQ